MAKTMASPKPHRRGDDDHRQKTRTYSPNSTGHPILMDGNSGSTDKFSFDTKPNRKSHPAEYNSWKNARQRCRNPRPKDKKYAGVTFSEEFASFASFMAHVGPKRDSSWTLDRIDNDLGYLPGNVRWARPRQQAENRSSTHWVEHEGEKRTLKRWAEHLGIASSTLYARFKRGVRNPEILFARSAGAPRPGPTRSTPSLAKKVTSRFREIEEVTPYGLTPVKRPPSKRKLARSVFERGRAAWRESEVREARERQEKAKRLETERVLRTSYDREAVEWRRENGVSEAEALEHHGGLTVEEWWAKWWREEVESERADYRSGVRRRVTGVLAEALQMAEQTPDLGETVEDVMRERGIKAPDLLAAVLSLLVTKPVEQPLLGASVIIDGRADEVGGPFHENDKTDGHFSGEQRDDVTKAEHEDDGYRDPYDPDSYSCRQEFLDMRDAMRGMGEWVEDDDDEACR